MHGMPTSVTPATPAAPTRRWTMADRRSLAGMTSVVVLLNVVGWTVLGFVVAPQQFVLGDTGVFGIGVGVTAFLLGVRHAFDADHIAAIDNTTRKLVGDGRPALGVGFWFSLGHSSVVFGLSLVLAFGVTALTGPVLDENSSLQRTLGFVGALVAGGFLLLIGLMNAFAVVGIARVARDLRAGAFGEAELERHLHNRGFLARVLGTMMRRVDKPRHMYVVGLLMGLGFDTATQVALLVLAAGTAAFTLPWYAILVLPVLFAAGMSLFDTADGVFMARAYTWAFISPVRKVFYNLTVTGLSVIAALTIGAVLLIQLVAESMDVRTGPVAWVAAWDLERVGLLLAGLFLLTWMVAVAVWRIGRVEQRWTAADGDA